jgi:peptidoglycan/xylan/chitin deacetylase (PgdA/CDA1 family)
MSRAPGFKRWLKRVARRGFARGSRLAGRRGSGPPPGFRILTYHRIAADPGDSFAVAPDDFRVQMETLRATGALVDLERGVAGIASDTGPRIALSFDDGTEDFVAAALPLLVRLGIPATLFVNPARVGTPGFLGWDALRVLPDSGITVGSHSLEHRSLGRMPREEVRRQVDSSRRILEERLGREVVSLAYPFGTVRDFGPVVVEEARRAGYRFACTSVNGMNRPGVDPFQLRRTKIEQGDGPIYRGILAGWMDGWEFVDRHLWFLQSRYG